jgi:pyruvate kinase
MQRKRQAKILATLGPESASEERIAALFEAGVDVFRVNFSHGTQAEHAQRIEAIRRVEKRSGRAIGIVADLQGPKLRVGEFEGGSTRLEAGQAFRLDLARQPGDNRRAPLPHPEIFKALSSGTDLLLDDGKIRLRVEACGADFAETRVVTGGPLSDHKGVNVPRAIMEMSALTPKDRSDLAFALDHGVDWIALSFVQRPEDVAEARALSGGRAGILAKLEKPSAVDTLDRIIETADAVMVARGDLGVEVPAEDVPSIQKQIVRACRRAGRPVVVATQMLDSMVSAPMPTRAEASDVATAVYDGVDAVMLSPETAVGKYAVEAVEMMSRIIRRVEKDPHYAKLLHAEPHEIMPTTADAITAAASQSAHTLSAAAIATLTSTGSTTLRAARERPGVPILGLTPYVEIARRLALAWGVHAFQVCRVERVAEMVDVATEVALREGFAKTGDRLVMTAGVPFGTPGTTNTLRITRIGA